MYLYIMGNEIYLIPISALSLKHAHASYLLSYFLSLASIRYMSVFSWYKYTWEQEKWNARLANKQGLISCQFCCWKLGPDPCICFAGRWQLTCFVYYGVGEREREMGMTMSIGEPSWGFLLRDLLPTGPGDQCNIFVRLASQFLK